MQVSVEATNSLERRLTITVPADHINSAVDKKVQETAKTIRLDGFRQGKVPAKVVKKRYGTSIRQDVIGDVIQSSYFEALQESEINPAGMPEIEPQDGTGEGDFIYVAVVEVYPKITLADASVLKVERQVSNIVDADIDNLIENLRQQHTDWQEVERACADGDQVNIDFEGYVDGEAFDGGAGQGHDLILGSNSMIPGFEEGIVGMSMGEEKDINVTFPEDYQAEHLAGKEAAFKITLHKVSESVLPELNDEFYAKFNPKNEGAEGFRNDIEKNMQRELKQALESKLKTDVLNAYLELCQFEVPKALVKGEIDRLKQEALQRFGGNQNLDLSVFPDEMFQDQADKRVKVGLLVAEIIKSNVMKADDDKVNTLIAEMAEGYESPDEFIDYYSSNQEQRAQLESVVLEGMVIEHLLAEGNVTDVEVDYETAVKPVEKAV